MSWHRWTSRLLGYGSGIIGGALLSATTTHVVYGNQSPQPTHTGKSSAEVKNGVTPDNSSNSMKGGLEEAIRKAQEACLRIKEKYGLPGLSVAVSVNGCVCWAQGFGYADIENRVRMSSTSVIRIASISKPITMAMLAQLMEQGKIDLDAPIQHHLPTFPQKIVDSQPVVITTRHLLSHLSGIRHYTKVGAEPKNGKKGEVGGASDSTLKEFLSKQGCESIEQAIELFKDDELFHKPGTKYLYTTHGWTLVSAIIEKLTEKPFAKHAKQMFDFWGLKNTHLDEHGPIIYNRASHYSKDKDGRLVNSPWVDNSCKWAGGGFLSNVEDLLTFAHILLYSKQQRAPCGGGSKGFLLPQTMDEIWKGNEATAQPQSLDALYALGFVVGAPFTNCVFCKQRDLVHVSHSGGAVGATSILLITFPPGAQAGGEGQVKGVAVAIITNLMDAGLSATAREIAELFKPFI